MITPRFRPQPQRPKRLLQGLFDYAKTSPVAMFSAAALTTGGLVILGFFLRVGFMPDVDLAASTALLFAAALVGVGIVIALAFSTAMAGVATRFVIDGLKLALTRQEHWVVAAPACLLLMAICLETALLESERRQSPTSWLLYSVCFAVALALAHVWQLHVRKQPVVKRAFSLAHARVSVMQIGGLAFCALIWILCLLLAMQAAFGIVAQSAMGTARQVLLIGAWIVLVVGINMAVARIQSRYVLLAAPICGGVCILVLGSLSGSFSAISAATVKALGFGELGNVDVALTAGACEAINAMHDGEPCESDSSGQARIVRGAILRLRMGSQMLLELPCVEKAGSTMAARIVVRKEDVIVWKTNASAKSSRSCPSS